MDQRDEFEAICKRIEWIPGPRFGEGYFGGTDNNCYALFQAATLAAARKCAEICRTESERHAATDDGYSEGARIAASECADEIEKTFGIEG